VLKYRGHENHIQEVYSTHFLGNGSTRYTERYRLELGRGNRNTLSVRYRTEIISTVLDRCRIRDVLTS
jgi:hypothetical protein